MDSALGKTGTQLFQDNDCLYILFWRRLLDIWGIWGGGVERKRWAVRERRIHTTGEHSHRAFPQMANTIHVLGSPCFAEELSPIENSFGIYKEELRNS